MRLRALSAAVAVLALVAGIAAAQQFPSIGQLMDQSAQDKRELEPTRCPGVGDASGPMAYNAKLRRFVCAATPTPGSGGGGSETCVTCTRSSATVYSCSGLSSIGKLWVGAGQQSIVGSCGGLNQAIVSGSTATFCYDTDAASGPVRQVVKGCGS